MVEHRFLEFSLDVVLFAGQYSLLVFFVFLGLDAIRFNLSLGIPSNLSTFHSRRGVVCLGHEAIAETEPRSSLRHSAIGVTNTRHRKTPVPRPG